MAQAQVNSQIATISFEQNFKIVADMGFTKIVVVSLKDGGKIVGSLQPQTEQRYDPSFVAPTLQQIVIGNGINVLDNITFSGSFTIIAYQ